MPHPRVTRLHGRRGWQIPAASVALCSLAACWIIPWRLAFGPEMSYYTVGYLADEYAYIQRMAPLVQGATVNNPFNGFGDPQVINQFFLERSCQLVMTALHMDVLAFFWIWRVLFPLVLLALFLYIARAAIFRRPWATGLQYGAAAAALPVLYAVYFLVGDCLMSSGAVPLFYFLNRIPTNAEFVVSLVMIGLYLRFSALPTARTGSLLALAGALTLYWRPYAAVPWSMATGLGVAYLLLRRRLSWRDLRLMCGVFAAAVLPYVLIWNWNAPIPAHIEQMRRMYLLPFPYRVHSYWPLYLSLALLLLVLSRWALRPLRVAIVTGAISLAILPFICGAIKPPARELLSNDRFACYHLAMLLGAVLAVVGQRASAWRGRAGLVAARRWTIGLSATGLASAAFIAQLALQHPFDLHGWGHPAFVLRDLRYHAAYRWVREHTPEDALFLVDDGYDWTRASEDDLELKRLSHKMLCFHNDLFQNIARRRRVYSDCMALGQPFRDEELYEYGTLHWGTFGYPINKKKYLDALKHLRPTFVLWRRSPPVFQPDYPVPVPRGIYAEGLKSLSHVVYTDAYTEIWKIDYK